MTVEVFKDGETQEAPETPNPSSDVETRLRELESRLQAKDDFIEQLKTEKNELLEDLKKQRTVEELLQEARQNVTPKQNIPSEGGTPPAKAPKQDVDPDDLVKRVLEASEEKQRQAKLTANAQEVSDRLVQEFGDQIKANEFVRSKAAELGVSMNFLLEAASNSPRAFYELVKISEAPKSAPAPKGDVNAAALKNAPTGVKEGTFAWWDALRRENPTLYFSPKMSQQRMKDARKEGFYS